MDILTVKQRSHRMSLVRSRGNRTTEWRFRSALMRNGVRGWSMHPRQVPGRPDFVLPKKQIALFIDGCFWHRCSRCKRPLPINNRQYWRAKLAANVARSKRVDQQLTKKGFKVVHLWEHELRTTSEIDALVRKVMLVGNRAARL